MSINNKQWLGLPLNLLWGYIAIAVFMTGDGFELAFLSHYIKELGFSPAQASFAFTLYGLAAALSAWISGVVAEIITPLKTMMIGFVLWCVFHVLFPGLRSRSCQLCADLNFLRHPRLRVSAVPLLVYRRHYPQREKR